jgi:hypothetical protein
VHLVPSCGAERQRPCRAQFCAKLRFSGPDPPQNGAGAPGRAQKSTPLLPAPASLEPELPEAPELPEDVPPALEPDEDEDEKPLDDETPLDEIPELLVPELPLDEPLPELDDELPDDELVESSSSSPLRYLMSSLPTSALQPKMQAVRMMPATGPAQRGSMTDTL